MKNNNHSWMLFWGGIVSALLLLVTTIAVPPAGAVEPDTVLFSDKTEERQVAYTSLEQCLVEKLKSSKDEKEKESLLLQQKILARLQELPDTPETLATAKVFAERRPKKLLPGKSLTSF